MFSWGTCSTALHDDGSCDAGLTLLAVWRVRSLRQTGSDFGSTQHLPARTLGKLQPVEAITTRRQHSADAHNMGFGAMLARSTACGHAAERMMPTRHLTSGPARLDFQLCNEAADSSPNSLQHGTRFQEECANSLTREVHGHEAHECCQHESHQPNAHLESGSRSAAVCLGHRSGGQAPVSFDRAAMNDISRMPGSSSSSAGSHIMAPEHSAPVRARSTYSMVFEVR